MGTKSPQADIQAKGAGQNRFEADVGPETKIKPSELVGSGCSGVQLGVPIMPSPRSKSRSGRNLWKTPGRVRASGNATPTIAIFSDDSSLVDLVREVCPRTWLVELCADAECGRDLLSRPDIRMVLIDDEKIDEQVRGWLLDRVRRFAPRALLFYVAAAHSEADEKRARSYQAHYYTSKPLDPGRTLRVLESFLRVASTRDGLAPAPQGAGKRR